MWCKQPIFVVWISSLNDVNERWWLRLLRELTDQFIYNIEVALSGHLPQNKFFFFFGTA